MNDTIYMSVWMMPDNTFQLHPSSLFYDSISELHCKKINPNDLGKKMLEVSEFINNKLNKACLFECL